MTIAVILGSCLEESKHRRIVFRELSKDDADVKEDVKKSKGLDWQNNNFARESHFFVHFFAVAARLRRENP